jgi:hypothetical protein
LQHAANTVMGSKLKSVFLLMAPCGDIMPGSTWNCFLVMQLQTPCATLRRRPAMLLHAQLLCCAALHVQAHIHACIDAHIDTRIDARCCIMSLLLTGIHVVSLHTYVHMQHAAVVANGVLSCTVTGFHDASAFNAQ